MAKLRCQCGHKFVIDFERLTVQSARKVRCPECGQSFPLAKNNLEIPSTEVPVPTTAPVASPSNFAALITREDPQRSIDDDDWPIAIPLSELRSDPTEADAASTSPSKPLLTNVAWLVALVVVIVLSTGAISNGFAQQSTVGLVVTNVLLTTILFELWRIRSKLD